MKKFLLLIIAMGFSTIALSCQEKEVAWQDLFNGKDLNGWEKLNGNADYTIKDGIITGTSKWDTPNTFLATKEKFSDFILEYEVQIDSRLNAGVQIRSMSTPEYKDGRVHGYQVELDPSPRAYSGGIYDEARRGWLYNLANLPAARAAFKQEEWNLFRVEAIGSSIRVWLNGVQTADLIDDVTAEGFIALQVHAIYDSSKIGATVKFKNIRIITKDVKKYASAINLSVPQVSYLTNTLTEREKSEGWKLLWDGKTTEGWRSARSAEFPDKGWSIKDGILTVEKSTGGESTNGGDIVTREKYGNFILDVDFKITEGANSGIKYFVDTDLNKGPGSSIGCEFQILDDEFHPDAIKGVKGNRTMASLYDLITADARIYVPTEGGSKRVHKYEWNHARIYSKDNIVMHFLNGIKVVEYERGTQMWRALVAYSKYKNWQNFGELPEGQILLQDHGDEVHYKNIKIKTLK